MTIVRCSNDGCYFCDGNGLCTSNSIEIEEGYCLTETDYTEAAPEYQNEYWIRVQKESESYRLKKKGYKYIYRDLVLYTRDDIRHGLEEVTFDEGKTGMHLSTLKVIEEKYEEIQQKIMSEPDVMTFPEAPEFFFRPTPEDEEKYGDLPF